MAKNGKTEKKLECLFMLSPMSDRYIDLILGSLAALDVSALASQTGRMGTFYCGRAEAVLDAVCACFAGAWDPEVHMTLEAMFTVPEEVPAETEGTADIPWKNLTRLAGRQFVLNSRFRLFRRSEAGSRQRTEALVKGSSLVRGEAFRYTELTGTVHEIAAFYAELAEALEPGEAMQVTFSVNSPTAE